MDELKKIKIKAFRELQSLDRSPSGLILINSLSNKDNSILYHQIEIV